MLFQTFDDKRNCISVFFDNKIHSNEFPSGLTKTWSYAQCLKGHNVEYAELFCNGKSLNDVCPEHLKSEWKEIYSKLLAFYRSFEEIKINLNEHCFYDLTPENLLIDYGNIKNKITNYVFENYEKPQNYDFLVLLNKVLNDIEHQKLNIDTTPLKPRLNEYKIRQFFKKSYFKRDRIKYDMWGTKTGRLLTKRESFPILTLDKSYRGILKPNNDLFVEFDYNAAELRVMLGLLDKEQPNEDIHLWNLKNIYGEIGTREKAKKRIFAWLYNPKSKDYLSSQVYNREDLLKNYWDGAYVTTYFDRKIEADKHHALNYIIQSTAADLFLRQMVKVWKLLENKQSNIAFCIHDSLVIDFSKKNMKELIKLKEIFADTQLGKFTVNVSAGRNFGEMKKINI